MTVYQLLLDVGLGFCGAALFTVLRALWQHRAWNKKYREHRTADACRVAFPTSEELDEAIRTRRSTHVAR